MLRFSRILAIVYGVGLPVIETARRWRSLWDDPPALLDDYALGAILLIGAWASRSGGVRGRVVLGAAWGVLCGMAYGSIIGQWRLAAQGGMDPGPFSAWVVLWVKIAGTAAGFVALAATAAAKPAPASK